LPPTISTLTATSIQLPTAETKSAKQRQLHADFIKSVSLQNIIHILLCQVICLPFDCILHTVLSVQVMTCLFLNFTICAIDKLIFKKNSKVWRHVFGSNNPTEVTFWHLSEHLEWHSEKQWRIYSTSNIITQKYHKMNKNNR